MKSNLETSLDAARIEMDRAEKAVWQARRELSAAEKTGDAESIADAKASLAVARTRATKAEAAYDAAHAAAESAPMATTEHGEVFTAAGAPVHVTNAGAVARFVTEAKAEHEWPARAKSFGNQARLGSMSDAALAHDEAHPYDAYAGYLDADSGLETEPVLPHAWPPLNRKLAGGLGEQSIDFKAADKRAPRDPVAVKRFWTAHRIAREEIGLDEQAAKAFGDYCVRMGIDPQSAKAAA